MKTYAEKAADLIAKCERQNKTDARCHLDYDGAFQACPFHLAERIEANKRVASVLRANGDEAKSEPGSWSTDLTHTSGIQDRVRIER
jgi:hypothetical protein